MKKELKEAFVALGRLWLTEINFAEFEKRQTDQLKTSQKFLSNHVLEYQNTSLLVQAMLCTAANTSPVERGYMILQMVTSNRRNWITSENLEVLLLLGTLKIPVKDPEDYENERKCLEKKKWTLNYFLFSMRLYCKLVQKRKLKKKKYMICSQRPLEKLIPPK